MSSQVNDSFSESRLFKLSRQTADYVRQKKKTVNFSQFTNGTIYENEADRFAAIFFTNSFM